MTCDLKALGLALLAACTLGAVAAQGASAATPHEFHSDGQDTIFTGKNLGTTSFTVGSAGTLSCATEEAESTTIGNEVSAKTYASDTMTVAPRYTNCIFGGQAATVNFNHCAFVLDSDTSSGNPDGGEHADIEIECAAGSRIEIHTAVCTVTISAQTVTDAVRYENDTATSIKLKTTAKNVVVGKVRNTGIQPANGCLVYPTGPVGTLTGESTYECFDNEGPQPSGTDRTTPQGLTTEGQGTTCGVS